MAKKKKTSFPKNKMANYMQKWIDTNVMGRSPQLRRRIEVGGAKIEVIGSIRKKTRNEKGIEFACADQTKCAQ